MPPLAATMGVMLSLEPPGTGAQGSHSGTSSIRTHSFTEIAILTVINLLCHETPATDVWSDLKIFSLECHCEMKSSVLAHQSTRC